MSFVFVSHAGPDKKKIRHIVDALIAKGIRIWLDRPEEMGYDATDVKRYFHRIHAGQRWNDEINEALTESDIVLVCFSQRFNENRRHILRREATIARHEGKLLGCRVDDVDPGSLPDNFGAEQLKDLRADLPSSGGGAMAWGRKKREPRGAADLQNALELLIDDISKKMFDRRHASAKAREDTVARDPFIPYLIDRAEQEDDVREHVEQIASEGGVRPFFIAAPENECLQEFRERLQKHTVPEALNGRSWYPLIVEWPTGQDPAKFARTYKSRLAQALRLPSTADLKTIGNELIQLNLPVTTASFLSPGNWCAQEPARIKAWLAFWADLEKTAPGFAALPMLFMTFPAAKPGWRICPPGRAQHARFDNTQIWGEVNKLSARSSGSGIFGWRARVANGSALNVPPMLQSIDDSHVNTWIATHFKNMSNERKRAEEIKADLFQATSSGAIALKDFAKKMTAVFSRQSNRQNQL